MVRRTLVILAVSAVVAAAQLQLQAEPAPGASLARGNVVSLPQFRAAAGAPTAADGRALLDRYCVACHNERTRTADLALDTMDLARVGGDAAAWEHVVRRLRAGEMPPGGQAPARRRDRARVRGVARDRARPRRPRRPRPGAPGRAPAQPRRVRQRRPRPVRPRDRRERPAAARHRAPRLRQHRRGALGLADPHRPLPRRRPAHQPARGRRRRAPAGGPHLPGARGDEPGRRGEPRPAPGVSRRRRRRASLPGRRRVRHPREPAEAGVRLRAGHGAAPPDGRAPRRRPRRHLHGGPRVGGRPVAPDGLRRQVRPGLRLAVVPRVGAVRPERRQGARRARPRDRRPAPGGGGVRAPVGPARGVAAAARRPVDLLARPGRDAGRQPRGVGGADHRSLRPRRDRGPRDP